MLLCNVLIGYDLPAKCKSFMNSFDRTISLSSARLLYLFVKCYLSMRSLLRCVRKERTYSLIITSTNLNVFLLFLAHIILMIRFTKTCNTCFHNLLITVTLCSFDVIMTSSKMAFCGKVASN